MRPFFYKRRFFFIPLAVAAFLSLISFVVMSLWNCLLPGILHVGVITFWQAMGIFVLCKILFGFGKGGRGFGGRGGDGAPWMRRKMEEKFKNMTPEEREKFKEKFRNCGRWGHHGDHPFQKYWQEAKTEEAKPE
ncbi:MAG: DUF1104 domain-containing protein [Bacteroidota bacterium]|nr:DUF1104 domain-containing protein [Bacteroidota bacterium]